MCHLFPSVARPDPVACSAGSLKRRRRGDSHFVEPRPRHQSEGEGVVGWRRAFFKAFDRHRGGQGASQVPMGNTQACGSCMARGWPAGRLTKINAWDISDYMITVTHDGSLCSLFAGCYYVTGGMAMLSRNEPRQNGPGKKKKKRNKSHGHDWLTACLSSCPLCTAGVGEIMFVCLLAPGLGHGLNVYATYAQGLCHEKGSTRRARGVYLCRLSPETST